MLAAGLPQVVDYLLNLQFHSRRDRVPARPAAVPPRVVRRSSITSGDFRFTGDLFAVPEGTPLFAGEPMLTIRAPIIEAQIPETYLLSRDRLSDADRHQGGALRRSGGRPARWWSSGRAGRTRRKPACWARAPPTSAAAPGTSNTLAGFRYGIPVMGTCRAFLGDVVSRARWKPFASCSACSATATVQLIDTYDTLEGARRAAKAGRPLWGVRLDSGDFDRALAAGSRDSGRGRPARRQDHGERRSGRVPHPRAGARRRADRCLRRRHAARDLAPTRPTWAPSTRLVELDICGIKRFTAKYSEDKISVPGAKQVFRDEHRDVIARSGECGNGEALLRPVLLGGRLIEPLAHARAGARAGGGVDRETAAGAASN